MAEDKRAVGVRGNLVEVRRGVEVVERHCGQGGDDDIVVGEVGVEGLAQGEVGGVVGKGGVDRGVGRGDILVGQAGDELLEVTDTLSAAGRVAKGVLSEHVSIDCFSDMTVRSSRHWLEQTGCLRSPLAVANAWRRIDRTFPEVGLNRGWKKVELTS